MPAATCKADLLSVTELEFTKLSKLLSSVSEDLALAKEEDTSIKDTVAHRAHWIHLFLGWYGDGQAGKEVFFPAKGYKWNDLKRYNAELRRRQAQMTWQEALEALSAAHEALVHLMSRLDDAALYGGPMKGANSAWTTGRWAEAAGPSHYRSAAKYIRKRIRDARGASLGEE